MACHRHRHRRRPRSHHSLKLARSRPHRSSKRPSRDSLKFTSRSSPHRWHHSQKSARSRPASKLHASIARLAEVDIAKLPTSVAPLAEVSSAPRIEAPQVDLFLQLSIQAPQRWPPPCFVRCPRQDATLRSPAWCQVLTPQRVIRELPQHLRCSAHPAYADGSAQAPQGGPSSQAMRAGAIACSPSCTRVARTPTTDGGVANTARRIPQLRLWHPDPRKTIFLQGDAATLPQAAPKTLDFR